MPDPKDLTSLYTQEAVDITTAHVDYLTRTYDLGLYDKYKKRALEILQEQARLSGNDVVLDIGCGIGYDSQALARRLVELQGSGRVIVTDKSKVMINAAKKDADESLPLTFQVTDAHDLSALQNEGITGIRLDRVLNHVEYPRIVLGESARTASRFIQTCDPAYSGLRISAPRTMREVVRSLQYYYNEKGAKHPQIADIVKTMFWDLGFSTDAVYQETVPIEITSLADADFLLQLKLTLRNGAGNMGLTDEDIERLLSHWHQLDEAHDFNVEMPIVITTTTR